MNTQIACCYLIFVLAAVGCAGPAAPPPTAAVQPLPAAAIKPVSSAAAVADEAAAAAVHEEDDDAADEPKSARDVIRARLKLRPALVNVRPDASADNPPVAVLKGGKKVQIVGEAGQWVKVRWHRRSKVMEGWVYRKFVERQE